MPPKIKYSRQEILEVAINLVRQKGKSALTARELAKCLNTSVKPIFTAFCNMEDLKKSVLEKALEIYYEYLKDYTDYTPAFKRHGMQFIEFAKEEPKLFELIFMREESTPVLFEDSIDNLIDGGLGVLDVLMEKYNLTKENARKIFEIMWLEGYGIATLTVKGICTFSKEQISEMLSITFLGALNIIKSSDTKEYLDVPK